VAPPGVNTDAFAQACLSDTYEVLADVEEVRSGIVGDPTAAAALLWPGDLAYPWHDSLQSLAELLSDIADELVVVPADVPDLPGLVVAKLFKALRRADVCCAPQRGSPVGFAAIGLRLPWPSWLPGDLDLDTTGYETLARASPRRNLLAVGPDWHRMSTPSGVHWLDPGLEGWESTRALLSGQAFRV